MILNWRKLCHVRDIWQFSETQIVGTGNRVWHLLDRANDVVKHMMHRAVLTAELSTQEVSVANIEKP